jgi:hypothetical protein
MTDRQDSAAFKALRASSRRLLLFVETEIARQGGAATIFDDQFKVVGSRRIVTPGIAELHALGLVEHKRKVKCSVLQASDRWKSVRSLRDARELSELARGHRAISPR